MWERRSREISGREKVETETEVRVNRKTLHASRLCVY